MFINTIIFDLDGTLVHTPDIHYEAFNNALVQHGIPEITMIDHLNKYNGLSTRQKLSLLCSNTTLHDAIWTSKQNFTVKLLQESVKPNNRLRKMLQSLHNAGVKLYCASNCIRKSVYLILSKLELIDLFDGVYSSEDVNNPKPAPDMFNLIINQNKLDVNSTLIVEDSPIGIESAQQTGCQILKVNGPEDITLPNLYKNFNYPHIVIPMAGNGSRFAKVGYKDPKPFIKVLGKEMICRVVENVSSIDNQSITLITKSRDEKRARKLIDKVHINTVDKLTEGAACTVLIGLENIDPEQSILIVNSDQYVYWDSTAFLLKCHQQNADAGILTFVDSNPKWSFARCEENSNIVVEVAEKRPISNIATVGVYWWRRSQDFVNSVQDMISANDRTNGEFYVCPAFNHAIKRKLKVVHFPCEKMIGWGTPEDLDAYLTQKRAKFIAHRGNTNGPNPSEENKPSYCEEAHKKYNCDVEVDVHYIDGKFYLGHDTPDYEVSEEWLQQDYLWRHAKTRESYFKLLNMNLRCFYHNTDEYILTSDGCVWCYPNVILPSRGEIGNRKVVSVCLAHADNVQIADYVCGDYI